MMVIAQQVIDSAFQPAADFCILLFVNMGIYIHGDLDAGMAQLGLNIFKVKHVGAFHPAGHIMPQHVERGLNAQFLPYKGIAGTERAGIDGLAVWHGKEKILIIKAGCHQPPFQLDFAVGHQFSAEVSWQWQNTVALLGVGIAKDNGTGCAFFLILLKIKGVLDMESAGLNTDSI